MNIAGLEATLSKATKEAAFCEGSLGKGWAPLMEARITHLCDIPQSLAYVRMEIIGMVL